MAKNECMFFTPSGVCCEETLDFFDFQFQMVDGQLKKTTLNWKKVDEAIWSWLFLIRQHYQKIKDKNRMLKSKCENKQKAMEEQVANFQKKKHCYTKAIAVHNQDKQWYKDVISAFWQLARQNEEVKARQNRENTQFNI